MSNQLLFVPEKYLKITKFCIKTCKTNSFISQITGSGVQIFYMFKGESLN